VYTESNKGALVGTESGITPKCEIFS